MSLPRQIGSLSKLKILDLRACKRLESLPPSLGQLTCLEVLDLSECVDLAVPKSLVPLREVATGWDDEKIV